MSLHNDLAPILLVEDNPMDLDLTLRAFRKKQFVNEILVAREPVAITNMPLPASPSGCISVRNSASVAMVDGIGRPP